MSEGRTSLSATAGAAMEDDDASNVLQLDSTAKSTEAAVQDEQELNEVLEHVKNQQGKEEDEEPSHQIAEENNTVICDAVGFYRDLHQKVDDMKIEKALLDDDVTLPTWPHDDELTADLKQVWNEAKDVLRAKQELENREYETEQQQQEEDSSTDSTNAQQNKTWTYDDLSDDTKKTVTKEIFDELPEIAKNGLLIEAKGRQLEAKRRQLEAKRRQLEAKRCQLEAKRRQLVERIRDIGDNLTSIKGKSQTILSQTEKAASLLRSLSNHSQDKIENTFEEQDNNRKRQKIERQREQLGDNERFITNQISDEERFYENCARMDESDRFFSERAISEVVVPDRIRRIATVYNMAFENCESFLISPKSKEQHGGIKVPSVNEYDQKVKELKTCMDKILDENEEEKSGFAAFADMFRGCVQQNQDEARENYRSFKKVSMVGPRSQEVEGAQPLFAWVLDKILGVVNIEDRRKATTAASGEDRHSFSKILRSNEAPVLDFKDNKPVRFGDCAFTIEGCSLKIFPPDCVPIMLELKPWFRAGSPHCKVIQGGIQQNVSHLAKFLSVCFNWSGAGMDSFGTGLLATLAYVWVIRIELTGVGTEKCEVRLFKSKRFPLLSRNGFQNWIPSNGHTGSKRTEEEDLENELYPDNHTEDDIPIGFKLLYRLYSMKSENLFGSLWRDKQDSSENAVVGAFLGSGTFSYVFQATSAATGGADSIIKITRFGIIRALKKEIQALKELGQQDDEQIGRRHLPVLRQYGLKSVKVGSITRQLEYIEIFPSAKPLASDGYYDKNTSTSGGGQNKLTNLLLLALNIGEAIQYVHRQGISNNDISRNNILISGKKGPMLFDFSEATKLQTEIIYGFVGTPNFAHRDAHKDTKWYASEFHDFASLGFVVADLCRDPDDIGWNGGIGSFANTEGAECRYEQALGLLKRFCDCCQNGTTSLAPILYQRYIDLINDEGGKQVHPPTQKRRMRDSKMTELDIFRSLVTFFLQKDMETVFGNQCTCKTGCKNGCQNCNRNNKHCTVLCRCTNCGNNKPGIGALPITHITFKDPSIVVHQRPE